MNGVLGIIAEYNPFHNGHLLHLLDSKKISSSDCTICVMSGNFTQRGIPAICDKWARTQMALANGIDMVIELPTIYATSSAEFFAYGGIRILDSLGIVDVLSFGSECGRIDILDEIASVLYDEPKEYVAILKHELSKGISYPKARENALLLYLNNIRRYTNVVSGSNNILGIEYLKAIKALNSHIVPITLQRNTIGHNEHAISGKFTSSSYIRELFANKKNIRPYIPYETYDILDESYKYGKTIPSIKTFEKQIIYTIRRMSLEEIESLGEVSEGLENRIKSAANECNTIEELINNIKSKRYTETRIQRILLYTLLGITKQDMAELYKVNPYIRILGMNKTGKQLLSHAKQRNPKLPVITSVKEFLETSKNKTLKKMLELDILSTNIYTLGFDNEPYANLDYTKKIVIM